MCFLSFLFPAAPQPITRGVPLAAYLFMGWLNKHLKVSVNNTYIAIVKKKLKEKKEQKLNKFKKLYIKRTTKS